MWRVQGLGFRVQLGFSQGLLQGHEGDHTHVHQRPQRLLTTPSFTNPLRTHHLCVCVCVCVSTCVCVGGRACAHTLLVQALGFRHYRFSLGIRVQAMGFSLGIVRIHTQRFVYACKKHLVCMHPKSWCVCVCVCLCVCVHMHAFRSSLLCMHGVYVSMCVCIYVYVCMECMYLCVCVSMCMCAYACIQIKFATYA